MNENTPVSIRVMCGKEDACRIGKDVSGESRSNAAIQMGCEVSDACVRACVQLENIGNYKLPINAPLVGMKEVDADGQTQALFVVDVTKPDRENPQKV